MTAGEFKVIRAIEDVVVLGSSDARFVLSSGSLGGAGVFRLPMVSLTHSVLFGITFVCNDLETTGLVFGLMAVCASAA